MKPATPHYITTTAGQIRLWQAGSGGDLVVLPGLISSAEEIATRLSTLCSGWRVIVPELPGIGGSANIGPSTPDEMATTLAEALSWLGDGPVVVAGLDLTDILAARLAEKMGVKVSEVFAINGTRAHGWRKTGIATPDLEPQQDGTHLQALWSFIRDRHLLIPDDPTQPATSGEALPEPEALAATVTAAAVRPDRYAALWMLCLCDKNGPVEAAETPNDLADFLGAALQASTGKNPPSATPTAEGTIWFDYVETDRGRMHLRRSGSGENPVLVIPTGGGSSSQFAPVVTGLAPTRGAFSVDFIGNGLSDKWTEQPTIESLAADMLALITAMDIKKLDVWGSHTGSLVALELAILAPERIGRIVMEGPVFISPDFQADLLGNYFPPIRPDKWGLHLPLVWNWRRDMFMYWPWYRVDRQAARQLGVPSSWELHRYAIGILESGQTYDGAYRSAFAYDIRSRLPLLSCPALICAGPNDMLKNGVEESRDYVPDGLVEFRETPTTVWWPDPDPVLAERTMDIYRTFLAA